MAQRMSRRQLIGAGSAAALTQTENAQAQQQRQRSGGPGRAAFWEPGPNKNLVRNLKPGTSRVRLAGRLAGGGRGETPNIASGVKALRDQGLTSAITVKAPWDTASEATISELRGALKEHDVEIFEVGGYRNI